MPFEMKMGRFLRWLFVGCILYTATCIAESTIIIGIITICLTLLFQVYVRILQQESQ